MPGSSVGTGARPLTLADSLVPPIPEPPLRQSLRSQLLLGLGAAISFFAAATFTRPVFLGQVPVAERLLHPESTQVARFHRIRSAVAPQAPWLYAPATMAVETDQFRADRDAFAEDLVRTGRLNRKRAEKLADVAVREAYRRRVPPALVLGVMLTENSQFKSTARSKVGAVGLMQIDGSAWRRSLGRLFGRNLHDDATNVKYGVFILGHLTGRASDTLSHEMSWRVPLLRYNGCVRSVNTPNCQRYPDEVRRHVERSAVSTCAGRSFELCVAQPLWLSMREDEPEIGAPTH